MARLEDRVQNIETLVRKIWARMEKEEKQQDIWLHVREFKARAHTDHGLQLSAWQLHLMRSDGLMAKNTSGKWQYNWTLFNRQYQ